MPPGRDRYRYGCAIAPYGVERGRAGPSQYLFRLAVIAVRMPSLPRVTQSERFLALGYQLPDGDRQEVSLQFLQLKLAGDIAGQFVVAGAATVHEIAQPQVVNVQSLLDDDLCQLSSLVVRPHGIPPAPGILVQR